MSRMSISQRLRRVTALAAIGSAFTAAGIAWVPAASAVTGICVNWTGNAGTSDWNTAGNWSSHAVPDNGTNVCIAGDTTQVTIGSDASANTLQLTAPARIEIDSPASLSITGAATVGGQLILKDGTFSAGSVELTNSVSAEGTGTSTISSAALHLGDSSAELSSNFGTLKLTSDPTNLSGGTLTGGALSTGNAGIIQLPSDITTLAGEIDLGSPGTGSSLQDGSGHDALQHLSTITSAGFFGLSDGGTESIANALSNQGTLSMSFAGGGTLTTTGDITSSGNLDLRAGVVHAPNLRITSAGVAGTIGGSAFKLEGNLFNAGKLITGSTDSSNTSGAPVQVTGNYTQQPGGSLTIGTTLGVLSELQVGGVATLAATLNFSAPGPYNSAYRLITAASRTGTFSSVTVGTGLQYYANLVLAVVTPVLQAHSPVKHGQLEAVGGIHFPAGERVTVYLDKVSGSGLGATTVASDGSFAVNVKIPSGAARRTHQLIAVSRPTGARATAAIKVT